MQITELLQYNEKQFQEIKALMEVLNNTIPFSKEKLSNVVNDANSHQFVLQDEEKIIGCYTLCIFHSPTGRKADIEDVTVLPEYQGQHLGKMLMEHALDQLKQLAPIQAQLTSRPSRVAANHLYKSVGFQSKETNVYILNIE